MTNQELEAKIRAFFTADDIERMQYKIDAHNEWLAEERRIYGSNEPGEGPLNWYEALTDVERERQRAGLTPTNPERRKSEPSSTKSSCSTPRLVSTRRSAKRLLRSRCDAGWG